MNKYGGYAVLALALGITACSGKDKSSGGAASAEQQRNAAAGQNLILAAKEQGAFLPAELADPRFADESTLPMAQFQLPAGDFSKATSEVEPNNNEATATPIGPGLAINGAIGSGDDDRYVFEVTGEPQLYTIEAVGKTVSNLIYYSAGLDRAEGQMVDSGRIVVPNLLLAAGKHSIEVRPTSAAAARYTLRVVPLGKPDLRMEREPNDLDTFAQPLHMGITRVGLLLDRKDRDSYSFSLGEPAHLTLRVASPPDITLMVSVYRTSGHPNYTSPAASKGQSVNMDLMLPPGEYIAVIRSNDKGSKTPYKVRLDQGDPYQLPADREPNNGFAESSPVPADLVLRGSVGDNNDIDWYRLPTLPKAGSMRVQILGLSTGLNPRSSIHVIDRSSGREDAVNWAVTDSAWIVKLPANAPLFVQITGHGDYQLRLAFDPALPTTAIAAAPFTVSLPPGPFVVEAFSTLAQTQQIPVTVHNGGAQRIQVALEGLVSHSAWSVVFPSASVAVDPGKDVQVPMQINLSPDAAAGEAVQVAVKGSASGTSASAVSKVYPLCGALPVRPHTFSPIPAQMLGGLNFASAALGGHPVNADINKFGREKMLYDGMTPSDAAWTGDRTPTSPDLLLTVALAGDKPANIAGITLLQGPGNPEQQLDQFDVLVSEDGQTYRPVISGRLRPTPVEQGFAFPAPVRAHFAQLRLRSNQPGLSPDRTTLGEWKVIGVPGERPSTAPEFNIADPSLGGHIVWSQPLLPSGDVVLNQALHGSLLRMDASTPNQWVVGFRNNRAAQISRLEWVQPPASPTGKTLTAVEVSVSTESPVGPWTPIGSWKISPTPGSTTPLNLPQPLWGRFVRFSTTQPKKPTDYWRLAEPIRIYEHPTDATYRSILAEWGHYGRPAIYERMVVPTPQPDAEEIAGNGTKSNAKEIKPGKAYRGRVSVGEDEDWYRIDVPDDHNRISLKIQGDPVLRAVATLTDESGKEVAGATTPGVTGVTSVEANVQGGKTYYLRLAEPPRSIALVWDNSASIRNFTGPVYRGLERFAEAVQPGKEFINLLPFQAKPKFLLASWSDQPYVLQGAVQNYNRGDASSNAEVSLLAAVEELRPRKGSKAILLITDAASDGYPTTTELWDAISKAPVRIFTVELQLGNLVAKQQQLMQDWAAANDGNYSTFRNNQDIDVSFERASCYLRRPARYLLSSETRFEQPSKADIAAELAKSGRVDVYGIYFDNASATLKPESGPVLKEISDAMNKNPTWKLSVEGHTDNVGDDGSNLRLSRSRAESVKEALVKRFGIDAARLATAGFGASQPKESNSSVKGRARNRRVELVRK
jgi:outer membrane protein OmpA-like peptidoglycan-associated protein